MRKQVGSFLWRVRDAVFCKKEPPADFFEKALAVIFGETPGFLALFRVDPGCGRLSHSRVVGRVRLGGASHSTGTVHASGDLLKVHDFRTR